jgi:ribosomal protein L37AE/L43A
MEGGLKMEIRKKPIAERGRRNVYCPHYRACLDYAVRESWDVWRCGKCKYVSTEEPREEIFYGNEGTVPYYSLSREVIW